MLQNCTEVQCTSGVSGTFQIIITPEAAFNPATFGSPTLNLPNFYSWTNVNITTPMTGNTVQGGPFNNQLPICMSAGVDVCNVRFLNTLPALTSSGKLTVSVFYESPNLTFNYPQTVANVTLSQNDLINNLGYVRRYGMDDLRDCETVARYIYD